MDNILENTLQHIGFTPKGTKKNYRFVPKKSDVCNNNTVFKKTSYYQLTMYPNYSTNKHHIKKFEFNESGKLISVKEKYISPDEYNKFVNYHSCNRYKLFPDSDLSNISYPTTSEIHMARSDIINNNSSYIGYALI